MSVIPTRWYDDWLEEHKVDLTGKVAIVTGANSGTGFHAASALARLGCTVVLACRNAEKAQTAKRLILEMRKIDLEETIKVCKGESEYVDKDSVDDSIVCDNMSFTSVREFTEKFMSQYDRLDFLVNNAGIMATPYELTADGYESQIQTNHLAHFLLTKELFPLLVKTAESEKNKEVKGGHDHLGVRVVTMSSGAHQLGNLKFKAEELKAPTADHWYQRLLMKIAVPLLFGCGADGESWSRYGVSKLANILFAKHLQKMCDKALLNKDNAGSIICASAHPGAAKTNLAAATQAAGNIVLDSEKVSADGLFGFQSAADGSLPLLMGCLDTSEEFLQQTVGCAPYLGPCGDGWMDLFKNRGKPGICGTSSNATNMENAEELWKWSEEVCGEWPNVSSE